MVLPSRLAVQITAISGGPLRPTSVTRGGCSPFTRASPGLSLTRAGFEKVAPASRLTDAKMSVLPSGADADQTAATKRPSAARETLAFARPDTASVLSRPAARGPETTATIEIT